METNFKINYGLSLILICSCFKGTDALCSQTSGGIKRFGNDCRLACHCMNSEQCNTTTGDCESGCAFEWVGPGCQYKNIALEQLYRQMDNKDPPEFAENANDRSLSTCSFTYTPDAAELRTRAPWFTVWLPYYAPFREIIFTTKTEYLSQFPRFNLTVQNISKSDSEDKVYNSGGYLCYQHDNSISKETTMKITCTGTPVGNQIRLQLANTSTQLVLCDFRVYGECKDRTWGKPCVNDCGFSKDLSQCDATTGRCPTGCEAGYDTSLCNEGCAAGKYGQDCSYNCSGNCKDNVACEMQSGTCLNGCILGYSGNKCEKECEDGKYGINCQKTCNVNCNGFCNKADGYCHRCKTGWFGFNCSTECIEGSWGEDCLRTCGQCMNGSCDRFSGDCSGGTCKPGFKFKRYCDEECETGWYGNNCNGKCSLECNDLSLCRKTDGYCVTESSAATTIVIAGVGTALLIVIIMGVLVIVWRSRNGSIVKKREIQAKQDVAMIDLSDNNGPSATVIRSESSSGSILVAKSKGVASNEGTDRTFDRTYVSIYDRTYDRGYETVQCNNEDEHQYEFY